MEPDAQNTVSTSPKIDGHLGTRETCLEMLSVLIFNCLQSRLQALKNLMTHFSLDVGEH